MRLVLLMSISCLWAGASALSFGRAKSSPDEDDTEGSLLRGRQLNDFVRAVDFYGERAGKGYDGGYRQCKYPPAPPPSYKGDECDGKVIELKLKWAGDGDAPNPVTPESSGVTAASSGKYLKITWPGEGYDNDQEFSYSGGSGHSVFHISCSDDRMNDVSDCGNLVGVGKEKEGGDWYFEGLTSSKDSVIVCPDATTVRKLSSGKGEGTGSSGKGEGKGSSGKGDGKGSSGKGEGKGDGKGSSGKGGGKGSSKGSKSKGSKSKGSKSKGSKSKGSKSGGKGYYPPEYCICRPEEGDKDCHYEDGSEECCYGKCVPTGTCPTPKPPPAPTSKPVYPPPTSKPKPEECPDCGELNERCCYPGYDENIDDDGSHCFDGLVCDSSTPGDGKCIPCGDAGEPCCEGNDQDDLCTNDHVCEHDDGSPTGKTCVKETPCDCPTCICTTEAPPGCIPNGEKECYSLDDCCGSDTCDESKICCREQFKECTFEGSTPDFLDDQCCDDIERPDGKRTCQELGETDKAKCCGLRGEAICYGNDECCGDLLCGVFEDTIPDKHKPVPEEIKDSCCVPPWKDLYDEYNGMVYGNEPKCKSGYKPLNVVLESTTYDMSYWNECCDPDDYCDPNGNCVPCLPPNGIGCTSEPGACCGGKKRDGDLVDCALSKDEPHTRAEQASNQCCVLNRKKGCAILGDAPEFSTFHDKVCCQFETYNFQCVDNTCCIKAGEKCVGDDTLILNPDGAGASTQDRPSGGTTYEDLNCCSGQCDSNKFCI